MKNFQQFNNKNKGLQIQSQKQPQENLSPSRASELWPFHGAFRTNLGTPVGTWVTAAAATEQRKSGQVE